MSQLVVCNDCNKEGHICFSKQSCVSCNLTCQNCGDCTFCHDCAPESLYVLRDTLKRYCAPCFVDMATRNRSGDDDRRAFSFEEAIVDVFH